MNKSLTTNIKIVFSVLRRIEENNSREERKEKEEEYL
jgi:hypothetical protein